MIHNLSQNLVRDIPFSVIIISNSDHQLTITFHCGIDKQVPVTNEEKHNSFLFTKKDSPMFSQKCDAVAQIASAHKSSLLLDSSHGLSSTCNFKTESEGRSFEKISHTSVANQCPKIGMLLLKGSIFFVGLLQAAEAEWDGTGGSCSCSKHTASRKRGLMHWKNFDETCTCNKLAHSSNNTSGP